MCSFLDSPVSSSVRPIPCINIGTPSPGFVGCAIQNSPLFDRPPPIPQIFLVSGMRGAQEASRQKVICITNARRRILISLELIIAPPQSQLHPESTPLPPARTEKILLLGQIGGYCSIAEFLSGVVKDAT